MVRLVSTETKHFKFRQPSVERTEHMCLYTHSISNFLNKSLGYWQHKFASDCKIKGKLLLNISCLEVAAKLDCSLDGQREI